MCKKMIDKISNTNFNYILSISAPNVQWNKAYGPLIKDLRDYMFKYRVKDKLKINYKEVLKVCMHMKE